MKIVIAVPHYFYPDPSKRYVSVRADMKYERLYGLMDCLTLLHANVGRKPFQREVETKVCNPVLRKESIELEVLVVTTRGRHLLNMATLPKNYYTHLELDVEPMEIEFECQRILAERADQFDYLCFLEDDLIIQDPLFFEKIVWFNESVKNAYCLLQANRFEIVTKPDFQKLYIDCDVASFTSKYQDITVDSEIKLPFLNGEVIFKRRHNPHAGSYFLSREQLKIWMRQSYFYDKDCSMVGPLESAATLGIMKTFKLYKAAWEMAEFFELQHWGAYYASRTNKEDFRKLIKLKLRSYLSKLLAEK